METVKTDKWDDVLQLRILPYRTDPHNKTEDSLGYINPGHELRLPTDRCHVRFVFGGRPYHIYASPSMKTMEGFSSCSNKFNKKVGAARGDLWPPGSWAYL